MALANRQTKDDEGDAAVAAPVAKEVDRRNHLRLSADDVLWLQGVRIKYGADVRVIDISAGGILLETETELRPGTSLVLEVSGPDRTLLAPARVVRCRRLDTDAGVRHQTACAFKRPLSIPDLLSHGAPVEVSASAPPAASTAPAIGQKVIARFLDGRLVRGYTNDFHASKPHLHLTEDNTNGSLFVQISQLKALFFVRAFDGDASYVDRTDFPSATHGRKVEVTFKDGEVLLGSTLGFRGREHPFFVSPADTRSNNVRVFVPPAATQQVRFF